MLSLSATGLRNQSPGLTPPEKIPLCSCGVHLPVGDPRGQVFGSGEVAGRGR